MIRVQQYSLDGNPTEEATLSQDEQGQLRLDGELVVAVSPWGNRVALTLTSRLVFIDIEEYGRIRRAAKALLWK